MQRERDCVSETGISRALLSPNLRDRNTNNSETDEHQH
jgi:hypothetical protein